MWSFDSRANNPPLETAELSSAVLAVGTSELRPVIAGDSLNLPHELYFAAWLFEYNTGLPSDSIPGTYRLSFQVYGTGLGSIWPSS